MNDFSFLRKDARLAEFAEAAEATERLVDSDPAAAAVRARATMEQVLRWLYEVDHALKMPDERTLTSLLHTAEFRQIVRPELWRALNAVRKLGNAAAHGEGAISREQAGKAVAVLHHFLGFVAERCNKSAPAVAQARNPAQVPAQKSPKSTHHAGRDIRPGYQPQRRGGGFMRFLLLLAVLVALFYALDHFPQTRPYTRLVLGKAQRVTQGALHQSGLQKEEVRCWQGPDGKKIYSNVPPTGGKFKACKQSPQNSE